MMQAFKLAEQAASQSTAAQQQTGAMARGRAPVDATAVIRQVLAAQSALALLQVRYMAPLGVNDPQAYLGQLK